MKARLLRTMLAAAVAISLALESRSIERASVAQIAPLGGVRFLSPDAEKTQGCHERQVAVRASR
jgi:hypothetical protein